MSFYDSYFRYIGINESPQLYHRWTAVSMVAALLGRQVYFPFGHTNIYPNFYILLVGDPGTRKNSAMWPAKKLLKAAGYTKFAPDRISPESFIFQLERAGMSIDGTIESVFELEQLAVDQPSELYVAIGEFGDFLGKGNLAFMELLTNLWDNLPEYLHPKLHGKSVAVVEPTVNIIGGTTPQGISTNIPIEAIGQGFMSRFIMVSADNTGTKITFPIPVSDKVVELYAEKIKDIKDKVKGEVKIGPETRIILDRLYREFVEIDDYRFKHYSTRRFTHLLKLCIIFAAMELRTTITTEDCINANTLLHYTELRMTKAIGEFGKAKNADVANNLLNMVRHRTTPMTIKEMWKQVNQDLNKQTELVDIIRNLREAGKIQIVAQDGRQGFLATHDIKTTWKEDLLNNDFMSLEERI